MGADIHAFVEVYDGETGWLRAEEMVPNDLHQYFSDEPAEERANWLRVRNYNLFGMLGYDRDGTGVVPVAKPRGLPPNASAEVRAISDRYGVDGHSHTWFTLEELLAVDWWGRTVTNREWFHVPRAALNDAGWDAERWLAGLHEQLVGGRYTGVSFGSASGEDVVAKHLDGTVTRGSTSGAFAERYPERVATIPESASPTVYEVEWTTTWATMVPGKWFEFLARMARLATVTGKTLDLKPVRIDHKVFVPRPVRTVLFFDN